MIDMIATKCIYQDVSLEVPSSIQKEITSFVLFDQHPKCDKIISITVCTKDNEVKEFYKKEIVSSIKLKSCYKLEEIKAFRNSKCLLFYIVKAREELFIISSHKQLHILHKIQGLDVYEFSDSSCSGIPQLKVTCKDDAVPILFGDDLERLTEDISKNEKDYDYEFPVLIDLKRKFTEAKYNVKCNELALKEASDLHQLIAYTTYKKLFSSSNDTCCGNEIQDALCLKSKEPLVKLCNNNLIIAVYLYNNSIKSIKNLHFLLNSDSLPIRNYSTKLYQKIPTSPFWMEINDEKIGIKIEFALVSIVGLEQIHLTNRIEFDLAISFKQLEDEFLMPLKKIFVPSMNILNEDLNISCEDSKEWQTTLLAMFSTTEKISLKFKIISEDYIKKEEIINEFCRCLGMEKLSVSPNIVLHKKCPYDALNGVIVIFEPDTNCSDNIFAVIICMRHSTQVLMLIRSVYENFSFKIVIIADNHKINPKHKTKESLENTTSNQDERFRCQEYAQTILCQCMHILKYFDECIAEMNSSRCQALRNKCGTEIDLLACGEEKFFTFKKIFINL